MTFLIANEDEALEVIEALKVYYGDDRRPISAILEALARNYQEPVRPISEYCAIFGQWADLIAASPRTTVRPDQVAAMRLAIRKSSYLARRLYDGEKHRTRQCPVHQGVWSGLPSPENDCECGLTGWLPEEET